MGVAWRWFCSRRIIAWIGTHRATTAFLIMGVAMVVAFAIVGHQQSELRRVDKVACRDRVHQYDALHDVVTKAYAPAKPSPVFLDAFPQLKPLYTPGNPQYEAQVRSQTDQRDAVLAVLGKRADCE